MIAGYCDEVCVDIYALGGVLDMVVKHPDKGALFRAGDDDR